MGVVNESITVHYGPSVPLLIAAGIMFLFLLLSWAAPKVLHRADHEEDAETSGANMRALTRDVRHFLVLALMVLAPTLALVGLVPTVDQGAIERQILDSTGWTMDEASADDLTRDDAIYLRDAEEHVYACTLDAPFVAAYGSSEATLRCVHPVVDESPKLGT